MAHFASLWGLQCIGMFDLGEHSLNKLAFRRGTSFSSSFDLPKLGDKQRNITPTKGNPPAVKASFMGTQSATIIFPWHYRRRWTESKHMGQRRLLVERFVVPFLEDYK